VLGGKIKTFSTGEHMIDEHYKAIYASNHPGGGRELVVHPDVVRWVPPLHHVAVLSQEDQSKGTTFQEDDHTIITKLEAESVAKDVRIAELEHKFAMAADDEAVQAVVDVNSNVLQVCCIRFNNYWIVESYDLSYLSRWVIIRGLSGLFLMEHLVRTWMLLKLKTSSTHS
jgi:hypothetical protein